MPTATAPTLTLNNGVEIPALGLGVFQTPPQGRSAPSRPRSETATG
jgi:diketogulonate reductase-like aldo/keto reductase